MQETAVVQVKKGKKAKTLGCMAITGVILPAVRASVADKLSGLGYGQQSIADDLGIAQAAVSKYRNRRYSEEVGKMKAYIEAENMHSVIITAITEKKEKEIVQKHINSLCEQLIAYYNS